MTKIHTLTHLPDILLVVLPFSEPIPEVINTGQPHLSYLDTDIYSPDINLPHGKWRIVSTLPEISEEQVVGMVDAEETEGAWPFADVFCMDYMSGSYTLPTALKSFQSAIRAEGYYLDICPIKEPGSYYCYTVQPMECTADEMRLCREYEKAKSRVLDPERTLIIEKI